MQLLDEKSPRSDMWIWLGFTTLIHIAGNLWFTGTSVIHGITQFLMLLLTHIPYTPSGILVNFGFNLQRFNSTPSMSFYIAIELILIMSAEILVFLALIIIGIRRLNDLHRSKLWIIMIFIPLFDVALLLGLLFRRSVIYPVEISHEST